MPDGRSELVLDAVQRSGLVEPSKLKAVLERFGSPPELPANPAAFLEILLEKGLITRFHADQLIQGRWKGFFIGKYKILDLIGVGGMGRVYLAEHSIMRRQVAVKILAKNRTGSGSALLRFQREARAVAALSHPNIIQAFDIDQDGDLWFMVMEYVDGMSAQELVKITGPVPWRQAADLIVQTCAGLDHAHESGLVHRDIKPGNILIDKTGTVKILDLGLAVFHEDQDPLRTASAGEPLTLAFDENVLGTADYLAPEQALDSHNVDIRADLYSLGATFHYLLVGQPPFPDGTIAQKLLWHQSKDPPRVDQLNPSIPAPIADVVARMMAKAIDSAQAGSRAVRYQHPSEVVAALAGMTERMDRPLEDPRVIDFRKNRAARLKADRTAEKIPSATGRGFQKPTDSQPIASTAKPPSSAGSSGASSATRPGAPTGAPGNSSSRVTSGEAATPEAGTSKPGGKSATRSGHAGPNAPPPQTPGAAPAPTVPPARGQPAGARPTNPTTARPAPSGPLAPRPIAPPPASNQGPRAPGGPLAARPAPPASDPFGIAGSPGPRPGIDPGNPFGAFEGPVQQAASPAATAANPFAATAVTQAEGFGGLLDAISAESPTDPGGSSDTRELAAARAALSQGRSSSGRIGLVIALVAVVATGLGGAWYAGWFGPAPAPKPEPVVDVKPPATKAAEKGAAGVAPGNVNQGTPAQVGSVVRVPAAAGLDEIRKAFESAEAGRTITLLGVGAPRVTPPIWLTPTMPSGKPNLTLEGDGAGVELFLDPMAEPGQALIAVDSIGGFTVRNLVLDGKGRAGPLMTVQGPRVAGLTLENVTFRNYTGPALALLNADGVTSKPIRLTNCRFECSDPAGAGVAVQSIEFAETAADATRELIIEGCRFLGPMGAGVRIRQPLRTATIKRSIFSGPVVGVDFENSPAWTDVALTGNTFDRTGWGLRLSANDPKTVRLTLTDNLYHQPALGAIAVPDGTEVAARSGITQAGDWLHAAPPSPEVVNGKTKDGKFRSIAPPERIGPVKLQSLEPSAPGFLRPDASIPKGSAEAHVGAIAP
jgi:serine/threonine protein kinase